MCCLSLYCVLSMHAFNIHSVSTTIMKTKGYNSQHSKIISCSYAGRKIIQKSIN